MTYEEIRARMAAEYEAQAGFAPDDASDAGIRIRVLAGEIYTALRMLEAVKDEAFPRPRARRSSCTRWSAASAASPRSARRGR